MKTTLPLALQEHEPILSQFRAAFVQHVTSEITAITGRIHAERTPSPEKSPSNPPIVSRYVIGVELAASRYALAFESIENLFPARAQIDRDAVYCRFLQNCADRSWDFDGDRPKIFPEGMFRPARESSFLYQVFRSEIVDANQRLVARIFVESDIAFTENILESR